MAGGEVGIGALQHDASAVVARAVAGETITITDRGRPVAQMTPLLSRPLQRLRAAGRVRQPRLDVRDLPPPAHGPSVTAALAAMRDDQRY